MTQYINKDALVAEIDRLENKLYYEPENFKDVGAKMALDSLKSSLDTLEVKEVEDKFEIPQNGIKDAIEVVSRMKHIDDDLKPIADFILGYASWNLHKDEWNQPTIEVPLFRVLDALIHRGKGYYCG